jgi:hypothetical protein
LPTAIRTREFFALASGAGDLAVGSSLFWSPQVPELNVIGLPWIVPDAKALETARRRAREGTTRCCDRALPGGSASLCATSDCGRRNDRRSAPRRRTDLKGLKVASAPTPLVRTPDRAGRAASDDDVRRRAAALKAGQARLRRKARSRPFVSARFDALGVRHVVLWGASRKSPFSP